MDKKTYVLKMLEALENTWHLAKGLKILVNNNLMDEKILDVLINTFQGAIKTIKDKATKEKLEHASSFLKTLKEQESEEKIKDQKDIENLENILANI